MNWAVVTAAAQLDVQQRAERGLSQKQLALKCQELREKEAMRRCRPLLHALVRREELTEHLIHADTDVRILGALGLDDYLGHCVLMSSRMAKEAVAVANGQAGRWALSDSDPKLALLACSPVLIDAGYEEIYRQVLDAKRHGITFETGPKDIETLCATQDRTAIYIVRSGSTVAVTPGLCVVGQELITSETIVAVNQERLNQNRHVGALVESLAPSRTDHTSAWRAKLKAKLGERFVLAP